MTQVFPTPVGVFPCQMNRQTITARLPHARGGVSGRLFVELSGQRSSPRPWGCFHRAGRRIRTGGVFPTPVGVFLTWAQAI